MIVIFVSPFQHVLLGMLLSSNTRTAKGNMRKLSSGMAWTILHVVMPLRIIMERLSFVTGSLISLNSMPRSIPSTSFSDITFWRASVAGYRKGWPIELITGLNSIRHMRTLKFQHRREWKTGQNKSSNPFVYHRPTCFRSVQYIWVWHSRWW